MGLVGLGDIWRIVAHIGCTTEILPGKPPPTCGYLPSIEQGGRAVYPLDCLPLIIDVRGPWPGGPSQGRQDNSTGRFFPAICVATITSCRIPIETRSDIICAVITGARRAFL